ncbi:type I polyketide synthase [Streptomyces sp. NBC_01092]|uniref:type I polyketide synthase n=1 Tax=Streptomyces sp. NBC_01092 TaxID=2903748 RepID=UPI0038695629|nr:type I polyketide synthase [Streptomyces sp. NBC_01092]
MTEQTVDTAPGAIAVVGMAGRFPGAPDLSRYWDNILAGRHAMRDLTDEELRAAGVAQRWIDHPDYVKAAAVLDDADRFDAGLFDITPREAALMDPQHRVFLETCWAALEHAGRLAPYGGGTKGASSVGVFGGAGGVLAGYLSDVLGEQGRFLDPTASLEHLGNDKDFLATRVSYKLGLTGPGLTVQTACSTSLVAVHLACQSLLLGECDTAVAGGVTIRVPSLAGHLHQDQGILSPDGRCRPFDSRAAGTVFGSGAGAVVLRPLADALRDGDTVYAVIRGTAVNNDGDRKTSYGASTLDGQLAAMRQALMVAEVSPATIGYVEAHGTGTLVGDPLEVAAVRRALGDEARCAIGSVKALVGHLEAAAGVAGLIKTVLALHHGVVPPSPHVEELNPRLRLAGSGLRVNREAEPWTTAGPPRRAAVNSLGIGGTNAFAVLEQAPDHPVHAAVALPRELLTVTAKTADALRTAARRWADDLRGRRDDDLADLAHTSQVGRRRLPHRVSVVAGSPRRTADELESWLDGHPGTGVVHGTGERAPRVAFLFTGQGSQYAGMAAELHAHHSDFRAALARHADLFRALTGVSLQDALCDRERGGELLRRAEILQPATFLLQVALHDVLSSWGVRPEAVAGHSLGEFAAAHAAGVLGAEDGLRLVAERGAAIAETAAPGGMVAVRCPDVDALRTLIEPYGDELAVAGHNTPDLLTLSGTRRALDGLRAQCRDRRWAVVDLDVTHAFHSPLMAPGADRLLGAAEKTPHHPARIDLVTNVTGTASGVDGGYWARQLTSPVLFSQTLDTLLAQGITHFVEVGPGRALTGFGRARSEASATWLDLLTARGSDWDTLLRALGVLDTDGVRVDWTAFHAPLRRRRVAAPGYPFARDRHWITDGGSAAARATDPAPAASPAVTPDGRGALDDLTRIPLPQSPQRRWATGADARTPALLSDHVLLGEVVVPGAYHTACLLEAYGANRPVLIDDLLFPRALVVGVEPTSVQVVFDAPRDGAGEARVLGLRPGAPAHLDSAWTVHAQGRVSTPATVPATAAADGAGPQAGDAPGTGTTRTMAGDELYAHLDRLSYRLGPAFRWIGELRQEGARIEADITVPEFLDPTGRPARTVLIDVCVQTAIGVCVRDLDRLDGLLLPFRAERAMFHPVAAVPRTGRIRATLRSVGSPADSAAPGGLLDIRVEDPEGRPLVELTGLELRLVPSHALTAGADEPATVHAQTWRSADDRAPEPGPEPGRWLVLADRRGNWRAIAADLAARGADHVVLHDGPSPEDADAGGTVRPVVDLADPERLAAALPPTWTDGAPVGVVHCAALDLTTATPDHALLRRALGSVPALLQALDRTGRPAPAVLTLLTRGAVAHADGGAAAHPQQFALWGAGRSAAHELSYTAVRLVDLDPALDTDPAALRHALGGDGTEIVLRGGRIHVPGVEVHRTAPETDFRVRPDGTHLITGGLGALGLGTALWLAEHGARHLVLNGRRGPDETARRAIAELEATGVRVTVLTADVAERAAADGLVARIRGLGVPLRGVFHAAGVIEDATLHGLGWDAFERVLAPKVAGAWNLHLATTAEDLDHFVMYSSTAALLGSAGQTHYSAANAYLDALAHHRRAGGLPALSVAWGPVTAGMTARLDHRLRERMAAAGFTLVDPRRVFTAVGRLLAGDHDPVHGVFELDWDTHLSRFAPDRLPANRPAGARVHTAPGASGPRERTAPGDALLRDWGTVSAQARRDLAAGYLAQVLAERVGTDSSRAGTDVSLTALGVDSMIAIEIRSQVRSELGVDLPLTLLLQDEPLRRVEDALQDGLNRAMGTPTGATDPRLAGIGVATRYDNTVTPDAAADLLASVHHLDDAELEALAALLAVTEQES